MAPHDENDVIDDKPMPLLEHIAELRRRLLWSLAVFFAAFAVSYYFSSDIYAFLARPLVEVMKARGEEPRLVYTVLYEAFFTYVKVALFAAGFISFPVFASQLWLFIAPGLYRSEKKAIKPFLVATPILFVLGASLAYYVVFPYAWRFFLSFQTMPKPNGMQIELLARVSDYLNLVMKVIFAFGVAFEMPVGLTLLGKVGIISSKGLAAKRRYAYVGCFIVAAILTPPDIFTQLSLALPLLALYEASILAVRWVEPKPVVDS